MADMIKLIVALTVVTALAGLAIGITSKNTIERIEAKQMEIKVEAISSVFPEGIKISEFTATTDGMPSVYWTASLNDELIGYAFEMSGPGYAGDIKFMVGVAPDGKILGITVLGHNETPGLGARISEVASSRYIWYPVGGSEKTTPWFSEQFVGLSTLRPITLDKNVGEWHTLDAQTRENLQRRNSVTIITGSTITTAAFTRGIERDAERYLEALRGVEKEFGKDEDNAD
jgi:electron transport complex protein RnfG